MMSLSGPGSMSVVLPLIHGADVLDHLRLAGPELPEVLPPLAKRQTAVAA